MVEFDRTEGRLVVAGSLDGDAEAKLRRHLQVLLDADADTVTLDLSKVDFISSVCVGALVAFWIDLRPKGRRMKVAPSAAVRKVLDMTGLSSVFAKAASARKSQPEAAPSSKRAEFDEDAPAAQGTAEDE
jgi:anti-anti-sigma factor